MVDEPMHPWIGLSGWERAVLA
jgi:hypothetical protein